MNETNNEDQGQEQPEDHLFPLLSMNHTCVLTIQDVEMIQRTLATCLPMTEHLTALSLRLAGFLEHAQGRHVILAVVPLILSSGVFDGDGRIFSLLVQIPSPLPDEAHGEPPSPSTSRSSEKLSGRIKRMKYE